MYIEKHQNAAGCKITVTATATGLFALINTAASTTLENAGFTSRVNAINLTVEDGDIRVLFDGNTPTGTNGILLSSGNVYYFRGVPLDKMKLIRVTANVVCSVEVGHSDASESTSASAFDVKLEAGDIQIGAVELKNGDDDGRAIINDANTARVATDNVLLVQAIDATGAVLSSTAATMTDDAAFTPATSKVTPVGFFADEAGTDSVDEGDIGAARMTLNRRQIMAGQTLDDAAFGIGTEYVSAIGALADETATDSVDEGDIGLVRMSLDRKLITQPDGNVASGATDAKNPIKIGGVFNTTPPALTTGQRGDMQLDSSANAKVTQATLLAGEDASNNVMAIQIRPLANSTYAWLSDNSYGTVAVKSVKTTAGNLLSLCAFNDNAAVRYLQLHNKATAPVLNDVPVYVVTLPPASGGVPGFGAMTAIDLGQDGYHCTLGVAWAISTTRNVATIAAITATEHTIFDQYI